MNPKTDRTILITGWTDGIGLQLARQYAAGSNRLILVGRRPIADLNERLLSSSKYCRVGKEDHK